MTRTTDLGAELERIKNDAEQALRGVADQVLELLDEKGLGAIVRARLANGDGGARSVETPKKKRGGRVKVRVSIDRARVEVSGPGRKKQEPKACGFKGCGRAAVGHGLCASHNRQRQQGKPLKALRGYTKPGEKPASDDEDAPAVEAIDLSVSDADLGDVPAVETFVDRRVRASSSGPAGRDGNWSAKPVIDDELRRGQAAGLLGNPVEVVEGFTPERRLGCPAYNNCLTYAASPNRGAARKSRLRGHNVGKGWKNWSCAGCNGPGTQEGLGTNVAVDNSTGVLERAGRLRVVRS